jgi:Leucine-rich repeat (LRR) protein
MPPQLGKLTNLTTLDLSSNHLTSLPVSLGDLAALQQLNLENNQLTSVPKELGRLKALTFLSLGGNPELSALPEEVEQLSTAHGGKCTIEIESSHMHSALREEEE